MKASSIQLVKLPQAYREGSLQFTFWGVVKNTPTAGLDSELPRQSRVSTHIFHPHWAAIFSGPDARSGVFVTNFTRSETKSIVFTILWAKLARDYGALL